MPYSKTFELPKLVREMILVRDKLRSHYNQNGVELKFTPDGRMVGDLGEAIAVELFGISLQQAGGIDGLAPDKKTSVQIKASGNLGGAAFRPIDKSKHADHLLFFHLDYDNCCGEVVYNGPEKTVRDKISHAKGQRTVSVKVLRALDDDVQTEKRLARIDCL